MALIILILPGCAEKKGDSGIAAYADSLMNATYRPTRPGAVVLVARDGVPVFRKAYGLASVELGVPHVPENVFAIASMSKQFAAVSILQLAQQGKISLQDDIRKHLPGFETHGRVVTVENLLSHTSGIVNSVMLPGFGPKEIEDPSPEELFNCVNGEPLLFEPGTDASYNDYAFTLVALIIEKVSGSSYEEYLQQHIFGPLGMTNTAPGTRERAISRMVPNYSPAGDTTFRPAEYASWRWNLGMGDLVTNADDMLKWDEALYTEKLVSQDLLKKAWTPFMFADGRKTNYGYGWMLSEYQGMQLVWHSGGMPGWRCTAIRIPSQHLYVIVLSNTGSSNAAVSAAQNIALRAAGRPLAPPVPVRVSAERLRDYAGVYESRYNGLFILKNQTRTPVYRYITANDTGLVAWRTGMGSGKMICVGEDLFQFEKSLTYARFHRDEHGKVVSAEIFADPWRMSPSRFEPKMDLPFPAEKVPLAVDPAILARYAGKYTFAGDDFLKVRVDGGRIYVDRVGEILAESPVRFFARNPDTKVEFLKNREGAVTGLLWTQLTTERARKTQ
jgi:D-alanyl-D-alanine carboxypeptidase